MGMYCTAHYGSLSTDNITGIQYPVTYVAPFVLLSLVHGQKEINTLVADKVGLPSPTNSNDPVYKNSIVIKHTWDSNKILYIHIRK